MNVTSSAGCACGARFTGSYREVVAAMKTHPCTLPPRPPEPPLTAADLLAMDDDAAWFDAQRDAELDAYDGGPQ